MKSKGQKKHYCSMSKVSETNIHASALICAADLRKIYFHYKFNVVVDRVEQPFGKIYAVVTDMLN